MARLKRPRPAFRGETTGDDNRPVEDLNFKVPPQFKRAYRLVALDLDLKLNELLFEMFGEFIRANKDKLSVQIDLHAIPGRDRRE